MGLPIHLENLPPGAKVLMTRLSAEAKPNHPETPDSSAARALAKPKKYHATKGDDGMNKSERAYASVLAERKHAGEIDDFQFEGVNFRLGDRCFYRPDFFVYLADGAIEVHEVKGFMHDDAMVKIRVFVDTYHFPLVLVRRRRGGWDYERFEPRA